MISWLVPIYPCRLRGRALRLCDLMRSTRFGLAKTQEDMEIKISKMAQDSFNKLASGKPKVSPDDGVTVFFWCVLWCWL